MHTNTDAKVSKAKHQMYKSALQSFLATSAGVTASSSASTSSKSTSGQKQAKSGQTDASLEAAERIMKMSLMKSKRDIKDAASSDVHTLSNSVNEREIVRTSRVEYLCVARKTV
jgi:hypothetical protein